MNDFEKQLQRQPMRKIPADWRAEILTETKRHSPQADVHREPLAQILLQGLGRFILTPKWSMLATAWVIIFAFQVASRDTTVPVTSQHIRVEAKNWAILKEQRLLLSELTDSTVLPEPIPADRSKNKTSPRSQGFQIQAVV